MYNPENIELPASFPFKSDAKLAQNLYDERERGNRSTHDARMFACTEDECKAYIALTYGMISFVDDSVGIILNELENSIHKSNTVVIFLSDHGDLMGDHQLMLKGPLHYDGLIRTPLIWKDVHGSSSQHVISEFCSTMDLGVTILDRVGRHCMYGMTGISLLPAIRGVSQTLRSCVLISEVCQIPYSHKIGLALETAETLRTSKYKMQIFYDQGCVRLYNLEQDPLETKDIWCCCNDGVKAELLLAFIREKWAQSEKCPKPINFA